MKTEDSREREQWCGHKNELKMDTGESLPGEDRELEDKLWLD